MPVQAPKKFSDKYAGVYDEGWTVMREKRRQAAIVAESLIAVTPGIPYWDTMTDEKRRYDARRIEV